MPTSPEPEYQLAAIERLRQAENPFILYVASGAEDDECQRFDVPAFLAQQRADIESIIDLYRLKPDRVSHVFPIVGDAGTGKTHLLGTLRRDLNAARQLFIVADSFPGQQEPTDFFLWQVVGSLLARSGPGAQMLTHLSRRLTSRLLVEAVRRLDPSARLGLIPPQGYWDGLGRRLGLRSVVDAVLRKIDDLLETCDGAKLLDLPGVCHGAGLPLDLACQTIEEHLEKSEALDANGWLRRRLFAGFARLALQGDREDLEDFLTNGFTEAPGHVAGTGSLTKKLLTVLLEAFGAINVPVILAFDQLEDFLRSGSMELEKERKQNFCRGLVALVNGVPGLCILLFAERGLWNEVLGSLDRYLTDRLARPFSLPGQGPRERIDLPDRITRSDLVALIRARVQPTLGDLEGKDPLPDIFPFAETDLDHLVEQTSLRGCLQQLSKRYGERLTPAAPPVIVSPVGGAGPDDAFPGELHERWTQRWYYHRSRALARIRADEISAADIPAVAEAVQVWLDYLTEHSLAGPAQWAKAEVRQHGHELFGYVNLLRFEGPRSAGLGIGAWLAEGKHRPKDLEAKLAFFEIKPAVLRNLVLLRRDGQEAVSGVSKDLFEAAIGKGKDIRVESLSDGDLAVILALPQWLKAIGPDLEPAGLAGREVVNAIVQERTGALLERLQSWRVTPAEAAQ